MICFVIIRHVNSPESNKYWIECYTRIREFYRDNPVLIVDSNSDYRFVTDIPTTNTLVLRSEFKGRGELQGYYYFYQTNVTNTGVILQDSMFINQHVGFGEDTKFLWDFDIEHENKKEVDHMISILKNNVSVKDAYESKSGVKSCFASCAVITRQMIQQLDERYNIFTLLNVITTPEYAMGFERMFGVLLSLVDPKVCTGSLFGDIFSYIKNVGGYSWFYPYSSYIAHRSHLAIPIIKVWTRRP